MDTIIFRVCFVIAGICFYIFFYKALLRAASTLVKEIDAVDKLCASFLAFISNLMFCSFLYYLIKFILKGSV